MDIPKFRSVEEIKRWISEQRTQFNEDRVVVEKVITKLKAACGATPQQIQAAELKILDITSKGSGALRKRTMNLQFPMVKVPNADKLEKNYKIAEKLSEQYKYLQGVENELRMNFKGQTVKDATTQSYAEVSGAITKLKNDVQAVLEKLFVALAEVAQGHAPKEYKHMMELMTKALTENAELAAESAKSMTYAALDKQGNLMFTGYIILINAINDQAKVLPALYIVLRWTVGGNVEVFVESEFVAPTLLHHGTTVENMNEITKAVERQLALEGFSSQLGQLPVDTQLRFPATQDSLRDAFSAKDYLKDVRAERNALIFEFKTSDREVIDSLMGQVYAEVKAMIRKKRGTTARYSVKGPVVTFTFSNLDHGSGLHPMDLEFLEDKYGLTPTQMRRITNIING